MSQFLRRALLLLLTLTLCSGCTKKFRESRYLKQADQYAQAGQYDQAKIDYMKVLQLDGKNTRAFEQLGALWLEEGAPLRAGPFLIRARDLAPKDTDNRMRLARVYRSIGSFAEAKKEALAVLQYTPDHGKALVLLTELAQSPADIADAEQAAAKFPNKGSASYLLASANLALRKNDVPAARKAAEQALAADPKSPEAHQVMGVFHLLGKDPKSAGKEFKAAAELSPPRSTFQVAYAEFLGQSEGAPAADAYLQDLNKKAPDFLLAWIMRSRLAFADKKYDETLKLLDNVFSRDPENIDGRLLQSDVLLVKREGKKASDELQRLDKAYPKLPQVKFRLAQAYLQQNQVSQAETALDQAIAANPNYTEAIVARAELNLKAGHVPAAISALEGVLKKQPKLKPAQILLADAYRASGRLDDAAAIFQDQIKNSPKAPEAYFFLGVVQRLQKKNSEARQSFEKALELEPNNLLALDQLISLDLEAKDFAAADRRIDAEMKKHPKAASSYLLKGRAEMAQAKWDEAEATLKKALELDPNSAAAYEMLVRGYLATNKLPAAAQELETVLAKAPNNQSALMTLATIRERQKDYAKAREFYEKLLALNPDSVLALNNLSYLYSQQLDQPDKAYELAQRARTLNPGDPSIADTLGWAAYKKGDYQQALNLFQESVGKAPSVPEIQFHLGMANYMMGDSEAARTAFKNALAAPGDFPSKSEAESRLALLGSASGTAANLSAAQLAELLKRQPNDPIAQLRLAQAYEKEGDPSKAVAAYEAALKINPKLSVAPLQLAQLYSGPVPNKDKALAYAKQARALSPNDPKVAGVLGQIAFANSDFAWASNLLHESARQLDTDPKILHDLAWAIYSLGNVPDARDAMQRSLKASPDPATAQDAQIFLALTALEGDPAALASAKAQIEAKLQADPKFVPALMADAAIDTQGNNKTAAITRYQQVLQRFPDFAPAQKQLAVLYADDPAHLAEAYDLASKARKILPDDSAVAVLLGRLSYEKKDYSRAIQLLQESARHNPLDATDLYYLGMSQLQANQKAAGREALGRALAKGLTDPLATEAKRAMAIAPTGK